MTLDSNAIHSSPIPISRALVPTPASRQLPALRRVALAARPLQLARVAQAAGALALGLAAEGVLRSMLAKSEGALASSAGAVLPAFGAASTAQPFEAARLIGSVRGGARLVITEFTVTERRWRR